MLSGVHVEAYVPNRVFDDHFSRESGKQGNKKMRRKGAFLEITRDMRRKRRISSDPHE